MHNFFVGVLVCPAEPLGLIAAAFSAGNQGRRVGRLLSVLVFLG